MPIDPKDPRIAAASLLDPRLVDAMAFKPVGSPSLVNLDGRLGVFTPVPDADSGADKHYGYAFQWSGLSGLVFILYVWFQFVRRLPSLGGKSDA